VRFLFYIFILVAKMATAQGNNQPCSAGCTTCNANFVCVSCVCEKNTVPVSWGYFSAKEKNGCAFLSWETHTESGNDYFEVQRWMENEFIKIGIVKGAGESAYLTEYSFTDSTAAGRVYFRLKQVDYDGCYEYSKVASAYIPCASATVIVYDMLGKVVYEGKKKNSYGSGTYIIKEK